MGGDVRERVAAAWTRGSVRAALASAAAVAAAFAYWLPAFFDPRATGFGDWQYFHHMWEVAWVAMVRYGEVALFDPYQCGGVPLWSDPQAQTYGPWFLLALLFGSTVALKIGVVLHTAIGLMGSYRLARDDHGFTHAAATLAAVVFCGSGFFAWHVAGGHSAFLPFYFAPLIAWSMRRAFTDLRHVVVVAGLMALTVHEGGVYPLPYLGLLLGLESLADRGLRELPRAVAILALTVVLMGLLGAMRFIPIAVELGRHPRPTVIDDHLGLDELAMVLTIREHGWQVPGHPYVWPEYWAFVGIAAVALGALGYHLAMRHGKMRIVLGTLGFGLLAMGNLGEFAPWTLLHELPVYESLRVPSRFVVMFVLYLGLAAAFTLDRLATGLASWPKTAAALSWVIVAGITTDIVVATRPIVNQWTNPALAPLEPHPAFQQSPVDTHNRSFASLPRLGVGSIGCYVVLDYRVAPGLRVGAVPQARVARGTGDVTVAARTTNTVTLDVRADTQAVVALNQNFAPDFVSDVGAVEDLDGLLAIAVPEGRHRVHVRYAPSSLRSAIGPFAAGIVLSAVIWRRARRRERPA